MDLLDMMNKTPFERFIDKLKTGWKGNCECCGRYSQIYKRQVNSTCVIKLIRCLKLGRPNDYVHGGEVHIQGMSGAGDFSVAKYWALLEQKYHEPDNKKSSGFWRLTDKGISFLKGEIKIPKYALVYDDYVIGFDGKDVTVQECLGKKFNYLELMSS